MPMIRETIVTTLNEGGKVHIAPLGLIAEDGIHIFNRDGHHVPQDAFDLFPKLGVEKDGAHAFYLGAELAKAEIAFRLAKRYAQDGPLDWGVAADAPVEDKTRLKEAGHTLIAKRKREAS